MATYFEGIQRSKETKKLDYKLIPYGDAHGEGQGRYPRCAPPRKALRLDVRRVLRQGRSTQYRLSLQPVLRRGLLLHARDGGKPIFQFADAPKSTKELGPAYEKLLGKDRKNLKAVEANWKVYVAQLKIDEPKR